MPTAALIESPTATRRSRRVATSAVPGADATIDLARYTPAFFTFIAYRLSRGAAQHYAAIADIGIETWRCLVMLKVDRTISAHRICRDLGMDKGSVSRCLKSMQSKGLVKISLDANDGRVRLVTLTKKGDEVHDKVVGIALERERAFLEVLTSNERRTLVDLLTRLHENLPAVELATQAYVDTHFFRRDPPRPAGKRTTQARASPATKQ